MQELTKVIPLEGDLSVEVKLDQDALEKLSSDPLASKLGKGMALIRDAIQILAVEAAESARELRHKFDLTELEIEAGLGFQAEGNVFLVKGSGNANLKVKFKIKPTRSDNEQQS